MDGIKFDLSILDQVIDSPFGAQQSELLDALQAHALATTEDDMSLYEAALKNSTDKNHFSYWFDKLVSSHDKTYNNAHAVFPSPFKIPKSRVVSLNEKLFDGMLVEGEIDAEIRAGVIELFKPVLLEMGMPLFMKGAFTSNKFHFWNCVVDELDTLPDKLHSLIYGTALHGAPLSNDFIIREMIPTDSDAHIYDGMPLVFEFRSFIDLDSKEMIKTIKYWPDSMDERLWIDDKVQWLVFKQRRDEYNAWVPKVHQMMAKYLNAGGFDDLMGTGKWSVDTMMDANGDFWIIDMAEAEKSAGYK